MKPHGGLIPVLPLKNSLVYPGLNQVIRVGREGSVKALKAAEKNGFWIAVVQQKRELGIDQLVQPEDLYTVGTLCRIESMKGNATQGYQVVLKGFDRISLSSIEAKEMGPLNAHFTVLEDQFDLNAATESALLDSTKNLSKEILKVIPGNTEHVRELVDSVASLSELVYLSASHIDSEGSQKQKLLELSGLKERSLFLLNMLKDLKENLTVQAEVRGRLNQKMGEQQRQHILREQLRTIKEELGEADGASDLETKLRNKLIDNPLPEEVEKIFNQELKRLSELGASSPETHIIRNYLELLTDLPWSKVSDHNGDLNLDQARQVLDRDHFGLEKVKNRIIQHLAVMKLKKQTKGSILLLVGPPGVGKTSLAQSVAESLGRKFVRVSLGGVRDDAEVRGHRRTYIGAMPGRLIQGLKKAGTKNPVFLLDEIDKLSRAWSGDPAAALLEVLDPEQNKTFLDHYLDVGFDFSQVFFILTANSLEGIPLPLLDRLEVIDLSGYTIDEKTHIAENHLWPKQLQEHGVDKSQVILSKDLLRAVITQHTREAGVRDLSRKLGSLIRSVSEEVLKSGIVTIEPHHLEAALGPERFQSEVTSMDNPPGVVTGLAWTPVGGDILFIESTAMPGKGGLTLTGQLGEVMRESAQIALSLLKSHMSGFDLKLNPQNMDFHIHVPQGATPKDGPSAGVTILTSLASLLSGRKFNPKWAMTGEISLRGSVLPVGGIKEKIIAAHRAGVTDVIMSSKNQKDLRDVSSEVKDALKFHFVDDVAQVLKLSLDIDFNLSTFNQNLFQGTAASATNLN